MPAILDVLFSMILGLTIVLIIINANVVVFEGWFAYNGEMLVQEMLISTATLLEGEFRNMGYRVGKTPQTNAGVILLADTNRIIFRGDMNRNGTIDEIEYFLGSPDDISFQNERIRILHRRQNNEPVRGVGYVTRFSLRYFSIGGVEFTQYPVQNPGNIYMIEIELEVQNPHALHRDARDVGEGDPDAFYSTAMWRQTRLGSKNLITR
jgi:hypothetical protein